MTHRKNSRGASAGMHSLKPKRKKSHRLLNTMILLLAGALAVAAVVRSDAVSLLPWGAGDQACVDLVYAMREDENHALKERMETRHGHRQLSCMKEMGMGNDKYVLIDLDNGEIRITPKTAVEGLKPFCPEEE